MKILLVDDEPLARERLQRLLAKLFPQAELCEAGNGEQALQQVGSQQPDLLLLDIRMPGMDGIEVAEQLQKLEQPPAVIFCTAYDDYALEALDRQAVAYLLKPVREDKLRVAVERAGSLEMVPVGEVRCFLAEQKYVKALHPEGELIIADSLKELEEELSPQFLRVHRNALVNVDWVAGLQRSEEGWQVQLQGIEEQPLISRRHVGDVKQQLRLR